MSSTICMMINNKPPYKSPKDIEEEAYWEAQDEKIQELIDTGALKVTCVLTRPTPLTERTLEEIETFREERKAFYNKPPWEQRFLKKLLPFEVLISLLYISIINGLGKFKTNIVSLKVRLQGVSRSSKDQK